MNFRNTTKTNQLKPYISWKNNNNNIYNAIQKNVKNNIPNNNKEYIPWPADCTDRQKYKFTANPIKHYRKQLIPLDNNSGFSNQSLIGSFDKPGNIVSTKINLCNDLSNNQILYTHVLNLDNTINSNTCATKRSADSTYNYPGRSRECNIIKSATTVLDKNYSSSNKEYLNKKCKSYVKNLPINDISNQYCNIDNNYNNCNITFNPSNKKYQTQGPVSSSSRIIALKYNSVCNNTAKCNINNAECIISNTKCYSYLRNSLPVSNNKKILPAYLCCETKLKKSNINILK